MLGWAVCTRYLQRESKTILGVTELKIFEERIGSEGNFESTILNMEKIF